MELVKKRESEVCQLRRDLEVAGAESTDHIGKLKKKHQETCSELTDKYDRLQKLNQK